MVHEKYASGRQLIPRETVRLSNRNQIKRDRTHIIAVLNVTPDSFSGDGTLDAQKLLAIAASAIAHGADVLDIGAESTRPGAEPVTQEEELRRLIPIVIALRDRFPEVVLSVDTYKPEVFRAAAAAGADILNLVRALDDAHLQAVVETDSSLIISQPGVATPGIAEAVDEVISSLHACAQRAVARGVPADRIVLDPGIGFGKTPDQNIALLGSLGRLRELGYATMLAASRKSTLGLLTGREPHERVHATSATTAIAAMDRIDFVRVHDVGAAFDVVRVCDAVVRRQPQLVR